MTAIIKTEFQKMKRYHILLIALIGMFCSPLLQLFSQFAMNDALKDPYYDGKYHMGKCSDISASYDHFNRRLSD